MNEEKIKQVKSEITKIISHSWFKNDWVETNREIMDKIDELSGSVQPIIESQASILELYAVKDKDGWLTISTGKPRRCERTKTWVDEKDGCNSCLIMGYDEKILNELQYEDEPIKLQLVKAKD